MSLCELLTATSASVMKNSKSSEGVEKTAVTQNVKKVTKEKTKAKANWKAAKKSKHSTKMFRKLIREVDKETPVPSDPSDMKF